MVITDTHYNHQNNHVTAEKIHRMIILIKNISIIPLSALGALQEVYFNEIITLINWKSHMKIHVIKEAFVSLNHFMFLSFMLVCQLSNE